ncbi:MAG: 30S ribosomal protein S20 [Rickettsiaceae bacterium]|nr:30S ribosomal protein S20 [Rickettsiaceae bacterium]
MANHSSAKKAIRKIAKRTLINKQRISRVKTYLKQANLVVSDPAAEVSQKASAFIKAQSEISRAAQKGAVNKKRASRVISRLSLLLQKSASV